MTLQASHIDEWLNRAFQLAFFLHGERDTALKIALGAMAKLETASNAQFKRYYYTPTGRAETSRATRSRVSLSDLQLLQRLVFVESENFERKKEEAESFSESRLLTYFVKHLVRISLKRNSFYVSLGISRILHNYATVEAMEIYNVVVQDPERVHDDYYYRSRKGVLMKELKARFGDLLNIVRAARGEERFQAKSESGELARTAKESLKFFTPWNSSCAIPDEFSPFDDVIKPFHFDKDDPDDEHRIEVNRIHATLHPSCFSRLTNALDLPSPDEKMEIPKFMITQNQTHFDDNDWSDPPDLKADELQAIKDTLAGLAQSRKAMSSNLLRILVDDIETTRLNLDEAGAVRFELDESSELIEVRAVAASGESVLATHLLSFDDLGKGIHACSVVLEGGQKVGLNFVPETDEYGEITGIKCSVGYEETAWKRRLLLAARRARFAAGKFYEREHRVLAPAMAFGLILITLSFAWVIYQNVGSNVEVVESPGPQNQVTDVPVPATGAKDETKDKITVSKNEPKSLKQIDPPPPRSNDNRKSPNPNKRENEALVKTPGNELRAVNSKGFTDEEGILRLPIRESKRSSSDDKIETRGNAKTCGKPLGEIRQIYIELTGDAVLGRQIGDEIATGIAGSGTLAITSDRELADAALKVYVRHESDGDLPEDATVAVIVRLVNAKGFIVYPDRKGASGWKYVGTKVKLARRVARDLVEAANKKKQPGR